jgi:prophage regulatory protein
MNGAPPDRLIRLPEVLRRVGVSKSTLYRMIREGAFPGGHRLSHRVTVWSEIKLAAWVDRIVDSGTCHRTPAMVRSLIQRDRAFGRRCIQAR